MEENSYQCEICGEVWKGTSQFYNAEQHKCLDKTKTKKLLLRKHSRKPRQLPFKCEICQKQFRMLIRLKEHMVIHTGDTPFVCGVCKRKFKQKFRLDQHMLVHTGERFKCDTCPKSFAYMDSLTYHKFEHMDDIFKCQVCLKYFATEQGLSEHVKNRDTDCKVNVPVGEEAYFCGICHMKGFRDSKSLTMHMYIHSHECEICKRKFLHKEVLIKHMNIHTGEGLFKCEHCLGYFLSENLLKIHKLTHGKFKCSVCYKKFEDSASLTKHVESHVDKPFKCRQCTRGFVNSSDLQRHMKTLTCSLDLPYRCEICGMAYKKETCFNVHMKKKHAA